MLDQTRSEVLIEGGVHLFDQNRVDAMWSAGDRRTALRYRDFEGHQRAGAKIRFGAGKNTQKFAENVTCCSMAAGVYSELCKSKVVSRRFLGRRCQTRRNGTLCLGVKPSSRAGEGEAVAAAAAGEGSEMAAISDAFVGGETAGALFVIGKTAMGARINGAWATPRRSPARGRSRH